MAKNSDSIVVKKRKYQDKKSGALYDKKGKEFEEEIVNLLNYPDNLIRFKTDDINIKGYKYDVFLKIINTFKIKPEEIYSIFATSDDNIIGHLPSGGKPKTDVIVNVVYNDNSTNFFTLNIKCTIKTFVSGHQYSADTFADVLDSNNDTLRMLLRDFQRAKCKKRMKGNNAELLTQELKPYNRKLFMWVLSGRGVQAEEKQYAQYLLTCLGGDNITIYTIEEYYKMLVDKKVSLMFGTFFSWTYQATSKVENIQLKIKVFRN